MQTVVFRLILLVGLFLPVGCSVKKEPISKKSASLERAEEQEKYLNHTVRYRGETLGIISRWYTGSSDNWKEVLAANPGLDPLRIEIGDTIKIPVSLVTKQKPLPKGIVEANLKLAAKKGGQEKEPSHSNLADSHYVVRSKEQFAAKKISGKAFKPLQEGETSPDLEKPSVVSGKSRGKPSESELRRKFWKELLGE